MSLILDALNKADNERKSSETPTLASLYAAENKFIQNKTSKIALIALLLVTFTLGCAVVLLLAQKSPNNEIIEPISNIELDKPATLDIGNSELTQTAVAKTASKPAVTAPPKDEAAYKIMKEKLIAEQYRLASEETEKTKQTRPTRKSEDVASIYNSSDDKPSTKVKLDTKSATPKNRQTTNTNTNSNIADRPNPLVQQNASVQQNGSSDNAAILDDFPNLEFVGDLPSSIQNTIPTIMYSGHDFQYEQSYVLLNNKKTMQGQQVDGKLYVERILVDGVILRYGSQKFKLAAMNSWVNI